MTEWITPRRNQSNPTTITPDIARNTLVKRSIVDIQINNNNHTDNRYNTLAGDESSQTSASAASETDSDSVSTMSTTCLLYTSPSPRD